MHRKWKIWHEKFKIYTYSDNEVWARMCDDPYLFMSFLWRNHFIIRVFISSPISARHMLSPKMCIYSSNRWWMHYTQYMCPVFLNKNSIYLKYLSGFQCNYSVFTFIASKIQYFMQIMCLGPKQTSTKRIEIFNFRSVFLE